MDKLGIWELLVIISIVVILLIFVGILVFLVKRIKSKQNKRPENDG